MNEFGTCFKASGLQRPVSWVSAVVIGLLKALTLEYNVLPEPARQSNESPANRMGLFQDKMHLSVEEELGYLSSQSQTITGG